LKTYQVWQLYWEDL